MPIIKSAIKKLRKDKKRTVANKNKKGVLKKALKSARAAATPKNMSAAFSLLDKAAKTHLIHKNKAARLKSRLSKLFKGTSGTKEPKETEGLKKTNQILVKKAKKITPKKRVKKI